MEDHHRIVCDRIRENVYRTVTTLASTQLSEDGIPGAGLLSYLRCSICRDHMSTRPLNVHLDTKDFICKFCVNVTNRFCLVMIPGSYLAKIRFPCKYQRRGCSKFSLFGDHWKYHNQICQYQQQQQLVQVVYLVEPFVAAASYATYPLSPPPPRADDIKHEE